MISDKLKAYVSEIYFSNQQLELQNLIIAQGMNALNTEAYKSIIETLEHLPKLGCSLLMLFHESFLESDLTTLAKLLRLDVKELISLLVSRPTPPSETDTIPPLYSITLDQNGNKALQKILEDNVVKTTLLTHPEFIPTLLTRPNQSVENFANSSVFYFFVLFHDAKLLKLILENEACKNALLMHPEFISTLLARLPRSEHELSNSSALFYLASTTNSNILGTLLQDNTFRDALFSHAEFIPALLARLNDTNTYGASSALYFFSLYLDPRILFENKPFQTALLTHPEFIPALLARQNQTAGMRANTSALYLFEFKSFFQFQTSFLKTLFINDTCRKELLDNPEFISTLLARIHTNASVFFWLVRTEEGHKTLETLLQNDQFKTEILKHAEFIPTLLAVYKNVTALHFLVLDANVRILKNLLLDEAFKNALLNHEAFIPTMFRRDELKTSVFHLLLASLPLPIELLKATFSSENFSCWIETEENRSDFIETFFMEFSTDNINISICAFSAFLSQGQEGQSIIKQLLNHPALQNAIMQHLSIPNESQAFVMRLLETESGFLLLSVLFQSGRTSILRQKNLQELFNNPQVQQLIHMQQIKPEWFLFIALSQFHREVAFFLKQSSISPWVANSSAHFLSDIIDELAIDYAQKTALKTLMQATLRQYPQESSKNNLWMRFLAATSTGSLPEKPVVNDADSNTIQLAPQKDLSPWEIIDDVEDSIIQKFNQYIDWILSQNSLSAYHAAFITLSQNQAIRNAKDFDRITLFLGERLLPVIYARINKEETIPAFNSAWNLNMCVREVFDTLNLIRLAFIGQSPYASYIDQVLRSQITRYNKLFAITPIMEIHAPIDAIMARMGLPFEGFPPYDAYLLQWRPTQITSIAQNCAAEFIHAENWFESDMVDPIVNLLSNALSIDNSLPTSTTIDVGELTEDHPLMICLELVKSSALFSEPMELENFLGLIFTQKLDIVDLKPIEVSDVKGTIAAFKALLQQRFSSWRKKQVDMPQHKIIHFYNELLWKYLTNTVLENEKTIIENLLKKLCKALDAPALIKYCLATHQKQFADLQLEQLFVPIENPHITLFSILMSNPFDAAWLFEYEINVDRTPENPIILEFNSQDNGSGLKTSLFENHAFKNALEHLLTQPGTLFFWLYYFQQNVIHTELCQAILAFIFSTADHLFAYDSLLPTLFAMQQSFSVANEDKILVKSFLENHLNLQLEHQNPAYWHTACALVDTPLVLQQRTAAHCESYPWLSQSIKKNPTAAAFLLNIQAVKEELAMEQRFFPTASRASASAIVSEADPSLSREAFEQEKTFNA